MKIATCGLAISIVFISFSESVKVKKSNDRRFEDRKSNDSKIQICENDRRSKNRRSNDAENIQK